MFRKMLAAAALWAICLVFAAADTATAATPKRVALVVGNSAYRNAVALANPEQDARAVAAKLRGLGFVVIEGYDLDHDGLEDVVKDFSKAVRGADIGMFFYAGHGMQVNGRNYLVPVDAAFKDISALDFEAVPMDLVMRQMQNDVAVRLVVLDACRDNPLSKVLSRSMAGASRSTAVAEGLAAIKPEESGKGTAIIFATAPDQVALDGEGIHSPFTTALLGHIGDPDTDVQVMMTRVTGEVDAATKQQQRPWLNASLTGEVILNPQEKPAAEEATPATAAPVAAAAPAQDTLQKETVLYNLARESGLKEDYQAYLETFPNGLFAANARKQIERLEQSGTAVASLAPPAMPLAPPVGERSVATPEAPLDLPITDAVRALPADASTEEGLQLDKPKRAEIQVRLALAGFPPGSHDGSFGARTRRSLGAWQGSRGLTASGYLNQPQFEILMQQTEQAFSTAPPVQPAVRSVSAPQAAAPPRARPARTKQAAAKAGRPSRRSNTVVVRRRGGGNSEEVGRFFGGLVRGALRF